MAGDWIKMRLDLAEDPAVLEMADRMDVREEVIVGYCHAFWCWVSRQCHTDSVTGVTLLSLGRRLNLPGFPELLRDVGWLEYDDSGERPIIRIPNFDRHLSHSAKKRATAANRQAKRRNCVTQTSRPQRDKSVTREEKRREEKSTLSHPLLSDPNFAKEWKRWKAHRIEKQKPVGDIEAETQLMQLGHHSPEEAARIVEYSTSRGAMNLIQDGSHKPRDAQKASYAQQNRRVPRLEDVLPQ